MRKHAPIGSQASSIVSLPFFNRGIVFSMLWSLSAIGFTRLAAADDPIPKSDSKESSSGGVSIRLELAPSAPEPVESKIEVRESIKLSRLPREKPVRSEKPLPSEKPVLLNKAVRSDESSDTDGAKSVAKANTDPPSLELSALQSSREVGAKHAPLLSSPALKAAPRESSPRESAAKESSPRESAAKGLAFELERGQQERNSERTAVSSAKKADDLIDRDFSNEGSESERSSSMELKLEPEDVPLEQEEHPFDAPQALSAAKSPARELKSEYRAPVINKSDLDVNQFSARELKIKEGIQQCLDYYLTHPENTTRRGPWALMHTILPFGVESEIIAGGRRVNTIGWLSFNGSCGKQNMFQPTRQGFRPNVGPGVQGHEGQFLAILAQSNVRGDYPLQVNRRRYTVMDLARHEMATCRERSELTFKLIGLSYYLQPNQRWRDDRGGTWSLEKMAAEEMAQPINGAACGGVHRLMGLSYSLIQRQEANQPITGHWQRAELYLNDYVNYVMSLQNPDGSFSTNWMESRGMDPDVERKVQTTGHILEWLVYTLPDDHLRSQRIELALEFLLDTVGREPNRDWPIGPRGHALRAMALYSQRVFDAQTGQMQKFVAEGKSVRSLR